MERKYWIRYNDIYICIKERLDVSKIDEYYIKNNGNFELAIDVITNDVITKKVVGTIALENRNNKYGILKRFYVDKKYQNICPDFILTFSCP